MWKRDRPHATLYGSAPLLFSRQWVRSTWACLLQPAVDELVTLDEERHSLLSLWTNSQAARHPSFEVGGGPSQVSPSCRGRIGPLGVVARS
jgi:hypothetical protein